MTSWWKRWTHKRDGWVERKRRFQKQFAEGLREATSEKVAAVATVAVSGTSSIIRRRSGE